MPKHRTPQLTLVKSSSVSRKRTRLNKKSTSPKLEHTAQTKGHSTQYLGKPSGRETENKAHLWRDAPNVGNTPGCTKVRKYTACQSNFVLNVFKQSTCSVTIRNRTAYFQVHSKVKQLQLVREQDTFCDHIMKLFPSKFNF